MATERKPYPSDEVLLQAGRAAWDWIIDTGDCHFCWAGSSHEDHDPTCPFGASPTPTAVPGRETE